MRKVIDTAWSGQVIIDGEVVRKIFEEKAISRGCLEREVNWLETMRRFNRIPNFIRTVSNYIEMQYMGEPITKGTIPKNWQHQVKRILSGLRYYNCSHNDIKPEDILIKDGVINLVDFGWATKIGAPIPESWPQSIGVEYKIDVHVFNDEYALTKSIEAVLRGDLES